jgi:hypothetical protein
MLYPIFLLHVSIQTTVFRQYIKICVNQNWHYKTARVYSNLKDRRRTVLAPEIYCKIIGNKETYRCVLTEHVHLLHNVVFHLKVHNYHATS